MSLFTYTEETSLVPKGCFAGFFDDFNILKKKLVVEVRYFKYIICTCTNRWLRLDKKVALTTSNDRMYVRSYIFSNVYLVLVGNSDSNDFRVLSLVKSYLSKAKSTLARSGCIMHHDVILAYGFVALLGTRRKFLRCAVHKKNTDFIKDWFDCILIQLPCVIPPTLTSLKVKHFLQDKMNSMFKNGEDSDAWIPVDVSFIKEFWLPDAEILNLKEFKTLDVLSKLEGLWLNKNSEIMYAVATRITFICPMTFNSFPLDVQVCRFQVGSFNYDTSKMIFLDEFIADQTQIRSVLDYFIEIKKLPKNFSYYVALTGKFPISCFYYYKSNSTLYTSSNSVVKVVWIQSNSITKFDYVRWYSRIQFNQNFCVKNEWHIPSTYMHNYVWGLNFGRNESLVLFGRPRKARFPDRLKTDQDRVWQGNCFTPTLLY